MGSDLPQPETFPKEARAAFAGIAMVHVKPGEKGPDTFIGKCIRPHFQCQPVIHRSPSPSDRQLILLERRVITASIRQWIMTPSSSYSTSVTRKCLSLLQGLTAVHLLFSSFFEFNAFIISRLSALAITPRLSPWYLPAIPVHKTPTVLRLPRVDHS